MTKRAVGSCGSMLWIAAAACALLAGAPRASAQTIWYVDDDAPPGGDGLSWGTAFQHLQDGVNSAQAGDEVRVGQGVYRPDLGIGYVLGDNGAAFEVRGDMVLRGGYAGLGTIDPDEWNPAIHECVLTADLAEDDGFPLGSDYENAVTLIRMVPSPAGLSTVCGLRLVRCVQVPVLAHGANALISECVWTHGKLEISHGAAALPTLVSLVACSYIRGPSAHFSLAGSNAPVLEGGGGQLELHVVDSVFSEAPYAINASGASVSVRWCSFLDCGVDLVTSGGAVNVSGDGSVVIEDSLFADCVSARGSGVSVGPDFSGDCVIQRCEFRRNHATNGGAIALLMENSVGRVLVANTLFTANTARAGAAIHARFVCPQQSPVATVNGCTFARNNGFLDGAIEDDSPGCGGLRVENCVFARCFPVPVSGEVSVANCVSDTPLSGTSVIQLDPLLIDSLGPDGMPGTGDEDLRLLPGSPAIDAADSAAYFNAGITCDFDGNPRFHDDPATPDTGVLSPGLPAADIGAFEYRKSPPLPCVGDVNGDCLRDTADLGVLLGAFGQQGGAADLNGDGIVDTADFGLLLGQFGVVCP